MCSKKHGIVCLAKYLLVLEKHAIYHTTPKLSYLRLIFDRIFEQYYN